MIEQNKKLLLERLDEKYDCVVYDECINMLKVRVDKTMLLISLSDLIDDLSKEIRYPLVRFNSTPTTYTFTYTLTQK